MPIISSIHIHILSDLQMDVRKHSAEEKIDKTIPGAAGEKKKSVLKQKAQQAQGRLPLYSLGRKQMRTPCR